LSKKRSIFRNYAEYISLCVISSLISALPGRLAHLLGRVLGRLAYSFDRRYRRIATANLSAAFPDMPAAGIKRIAKEVYRHIGLIIIEALRVGRILKDGIHNYVELEGGEKLPKTDKGMIIATAHIGNWELAGHAASLMIMPMHSVARPLDNPRLNKYVMALREMSGQKIIGKHGAVRDMLNVLKSGGAVTLLMDQDARRHGVFVDFFGRPTSTWPTAAALSLRLGCPIVFGFVRRLDGRFKYKLIVDSVFEPQPTGNHKEDVHRITQQITSRIEARVRECPEQWLWVHRRWKTPPPENEEGES